MAGTVKYNRNAIGAVTAPIEIDMQKQAPKAPALAWQYANGSCKTTKDSLKLPANREKAPGLIFTSRNS